MLATAPGSPCPWCKTHLRSVKRLPQLWSQCRRICASKAMVLPPWVTPIQSQARTPAGAYKEAYMHAKSLQSCPTLYNPMDCSWPDSSVHGILLASGWAQNKVSLKNWNCLAREKGSGEFHPWRSSSQDGDPLHARKHARYLHSTSWGTRTPRSGGTVPKRWHTARANATSAQGFLQEIPLQDYLDKA